MISFFNKHKTAIIIIVVVCLLGSVGYVGTASLMQLAPSSAVAVVGKGKIRKSTMDSLVNLQYMEMRKTDMEVNDEQMLELIKNYVLSAMVSSEAMYQTALSLGLWTPDYEIGAEIAAVPTFNYGGIFNKTAYVTTLRSMYNMTPAEFEDMTRHDKMAAIAGALVRSSFKATPEEIKYSYKTQHGNVTDFEKNKAIFTPTILETKAENANRLFAEHFNNNNEVKILLKPASGQEEPSAWQTAESEEL